MAEENISEANGKLAALIVLSVDALKAALAAANPPLTHEELTEMVALEEKGENRKGALEAIDAAIAKTPEGQAAAAEEARQKALAAEDAKLIRFKVGPQAKGADARAAARTGKTFLVLGDGEKEIAGLERVAAEPINFTLVGERVMFGRTIDVVGADVKASIHAVALIDEEGDVHGVCEIPGGITVGGRHVQLPAGSLIFG